MNRTTLIYDSITFPENFSCPLTNIIPLIPQLAVNNTIKTLIKEKYDPTGVVDFYYADFFKIFLKAIIKKAPAYVKNQIPELIENIIPQVEQIEEGKNRGIAKLKYLAKTLFESYIDTIDTENPVEYGYIFSYATSAIKKIQQLESPENFSNALDHFADMYTNIPSYSEIKKNKLKKTFKNMFIPQIPQNDETPETEEKENKLNYKKFLIPLIIFTGSWSIFTTILYKKQWLPAFLQQFIHQQTTKNEEQIIIFLFGSL